jgi:3-oxoacyl-[acyl-carrier-protein] synthase-3
MALFGATTIVGTGEAAPPPAEMVANDAVLDMLRGAGFDVGDKTGESTERLVGIATRWLTPPAVCSFELALDAARRAVETARTNDPEFSLAEVRVVHSGGSTPDMIYPAAACRLQHVLDVPVGRCEARDISLACTSALDGLLLADSRLRHISAMERARGVEPRPIYGIVAIGETIGTQSNLPSSLDFTLWGCGAGAVVIRFDPRDTHQVGILATRCLSDGQRADWTESIGIGVRPDYWNRRPNASMGTHGKEIHRYGLREIARALKAFVAEEGIDTGAEGAAFLPHNSNLSMQMGLGKDLGFRPERIFTRIRQRGNTSSASVLITLDYFTRNGSFNSGDRLLLAAFGGGMSMAFVDYLWP